jgi:hypothetical protein
VLLFRHVQAVTAGRIALAAADVALALLTAGLGRRRGRLLARLLDTEGVPTVPDAAREVLLVSVGALLVAAGTVLLIAVGS